MRVFYMVSKVQAENNGLPFPYTFDEVGQHGQSASDLLQHGLPVLHIHRYTQIANLVWTVTEDGTHVIIKSRWPSTAQDRHFALAHYYAAHQNTGHSTCHDAAAIVHGTPLPSYPIGGTKPGELVVWAPDAGQLFPDAPNLLECFLQAMHTKHPAMHPEQFRQLVDGELMDRFSAINQNGRLVFNDESCETMFRLQYA